MTTLRPHILKRVKTVLPQSPAKPAKPDDEALAESVSSNLQSTGYQQLRRIDVVVEDGHVRLSGRVARYYLRQMAQQAAMTTDGVDTIDTQIEVDRENIASV